MDDRPGRGTRSSPTAAGRGRRRGRTIAALDLGTNNCRLLIARPSAGGFKVIDGFSRIVRLGQGLEATGELCETAIERTVDALAVCAAKIRRHRVARARYVATEAARRAANCAGFLARVAAETGIELDIISSREEARLTLMGCLPLFDPAVPYGLIFDVGGGSAEIVWLRLTGDGGQEILGWISLPVGVVTLTERHGPEDFSAEEYEATVREVAAMLAPFDAEHGIRRRIGQGRMQMMGPPGRSPPSPASASASSATTAPWSTAPTSRSTRSAGSAASCPARTTPSARPTRRSATGGRTSWSRAAPSWKRSAAPGRREGCASPTAASVRASCSSLPPSSAPGPPMAARDGKRGGGRVGRRGATVRVKTARGRKPSSTRWLQRQLNDPYVAAAAQHGYRSRAAWKLIEIDDRFGLLGRGARVLDLGAAPGGWTQVAAERAPGGRVIALDRVETEPVAGAEVRTVDLDDDAAAEALTGEG